jgi:hypothetical protein
MREQRGSLSIGANRPIARSKRPALPPDSFKVIGNDYRMLIFQGENPRFVRDNRIAPPAKEPREPVMRLSSRCNRNIVRAVSGTMLGAFLWFGPAGFRGNDTGGIIPWSPGIEDYALEIAAHHCHRYGKYAMITSVRHSPGEFIGFTCRRPVRWGPVLD